MNNQKYYIVTVSVSSSDEQIIPLLEKKAFESFSCGGSEEFALDEASVDQILGLRAYSGFDIPDEVFTEVEDETKKRFGLHFKFFFYEEDAQAQANAFLEMINKDHPKAQVKLIEENWQDWNAEWKKHYKSLDISPNLKVIPEWEKAGDWKKNKHAVYIIPGMGFGTGNHETTCLCLKFADELKLSKDNKCLDFGCGSGILGIAAMKLHGSLVDFCDIDRKALDNCFENMKLNFEEEEMNGQRLVARDRFEAPKNFYDLTFANILEPVLIEEKELLLSSLAPQGWLIVSGLLLDQLDRVTANYISDGRLEFVKREVKGHWGALLFKKRA